MGVLVLKHSAPNPDGDALATNADEQPEMRRTLFLEPGERQTQMGMLFLDH